MTNRAVFGVVSPTVIGVLRLVGGLIGLLRDCQGAATTVLLLGLKALLATTRRFIYIENLCLTAHCITKALSQHM